MDRTVDRKSLTRKEYEYQQQGQQLHMNGTVEEIREEDSEIRVSSDSNEE